MPDDETDWPWEIAKGLVGVGGGFVSGMIGNVIRAEFGIKPKAETVLAVPVATIGGITKEPLLIGGSLGLVISDIVCDIETWGESGSADLADVQDSDWFIKRYDIPNWLPEAVIYRMLGDKLTDIITKPSKNAKLKKKIPAGREHPDVIRQAREIVTEAGIRNGRDFPVVARAVQEWVHDNVNYVRDPRWMDTFAHPYRTLQSMAEDCDGHSLLVNSMIEALGGQSALIIYDQHGNGRGYNHITGGLIHEGQVYPLETVNQQDAPVPWDWWPPHHRKKVFPV